MIRGLLLGVLTGLVLVASSRGLAQAGPANLPVSSSEPHSAEIQQLKLKIEFTKKPAWNRFRSDSDVWLGGSVRIRTAVRVSDSDGQGVGGQPVEVFARSESGVSANAAATTDSSGYAPPQVMFRLPVGALTIHLQACLRGQDVCTQVVDLSLRKWMNFDIGLEVGYQVAPKTVRPKTEPRTEPQGICRLYPHICGITPQPVPVPISSDQSVLFAVRPRFLLNIFESESSFRYSSVSLYTTVPYLWQDRTLRTIFSSSSVGRASGLGDFAAGVQASVHSRLNVDVALNGRNGGDDLASSIRSLGRPGAVNLGDGFTSIEANVSANQRIREKTLLAGVTNSRAFPRHFGNETLGRTDFLQVSTGLAFPTRSRLFAWVPWIGFANSGAYTRERQGVKDTLLRGSQEFMAGLNFTDLRPAPFGATTGVMLGGLGTGNPYFALTLRIDVRPF